MNVGKDAEVRTMDGANVSVPRRAQATPPHRTTERESKTLRVAAIYMLSEDGRKLSLISGGNGRAEQVIDVNVPANRLHLVSVDHEGIARLKLRPQYVTKPDGAVAKVDNCPTFDIPPSIEELFLVAAKNHELERTYLAQGNRRARQRQAQRAVRAQLAEAFLADPNQRALAHPTPSPKQCYLASETGRILFDAERDDPPARDVPAEAHRRFRQDQRATRDRNLEDRARRLALHEKKQRFVAEWVAQHGTRNQQERQAAGLLPMTEAIDGIAEAAFAPMRDWPTYVRNGAEVLQAHLRRFPKFATVAVDNADLAVTDANAAEATADEWRSLQQVRELVPGATITIRSHTLSWKRDSEAPSVTVRGLLVMKHVGPLVVRREFATSPKKTYG